MRRSALTAIPLLAVLVACEEASDTSPTGTNGPGEIVVVPTMAAVTLKQAEQVSILVDVTTEGVDGPVELSFEGAPVGMTGRFSPDSRLLTINTAVFGVDAQAPSAGTYDVRIRARAAGAPDATATISVTIDAPSVYRGGFTMGSFTTSRVHPTTGDKCTWNVSKQGTVTITYPDISTSASGVELRVQGTRWISPLQERVGNTNCGSGAFSFDESTTMLSVFPGVGGTVTVPTSGGAYKLFVNGRANTPVSNAADATIRAEYGGCSSCEGGSAETQMLLLRQ